jgi:hypothetical protein
MYKAIVARVRAGEPYHVTVGSELRSRGYASREIFNWRTPLLMSTLAAAPSGTPRVALVLLAGAVSVGAVLVARRHGPRVWAPTAVLLSGTFLLSAAPDAVYMAEPWSGLLIGAAVVAYTAARPTMAVVLGLLALFVRELAAPFCVACTLVALYRRRFREVALWLGGAVVYGLYYGWHVSKVLPLRLPTDVGHASSWLEGGGLAFVVSTIEWSGWQFMLPAPWNGVTFALLLAGLAHERVPSYARVTALAYLAWFSVAGKAFDHYWGLMAAPVWMMCAAYGVDQVARLISAADLLPRRAPAATRSTP